MSIINILLVFLNYRHLCKSGSLAVFQSYLIVKPFFSHVISYHCSRVCAPYIFFWYRVLLCRFFWCYSLALRLKWWLQQTIQPAADRVFSYRRRTVFRIVVSWEADIPYAISIIHKQHHKVIFWYKTTTLQKDGLIFEALGTHEKGETRKTYWSCRKLIQIQI